MKPDSRIAIYPGSFDPLTLGHEDIARRALKFADRVVVAVAHNPSQPKKGLFAIPERLEMIEEVFRGEDRIEAAEFSGLLIDFARARGAGMVIRGVRDFGDFEYELRMALMNRSLEPAVETIFLAPDAARAFVSASLVREISGLGGDVSAFVPKPVLSRLRQRYPGAGDR